MSTNQQTTDITQLTQYFRQQQQQTKLQAKVDSAHSYSTVATVVWCAVVRQIRANGLPLFFILKYWSYIFKIKNNGTPLALIWRTTKPTQFTKSSVQFTSQAREKFFEEKIASWPGLVCVRWFCLLAFLGILMVLCCFLLLDRVGAFLATTTKRLDSCDPPSSVFFWCVC